MTLQDTDFFGITHFSNIFLSFFSRSHAPLNAFSFFIRTFAPAMWQVGFVAGRFRATGGKSEQRRAPCFLTERCS